MVVELELTSHPIRPVGHQLNGAEIIIVQAGCAIIIDLYINLKLLT